MIAATTTDKEELELLTAFLTPLTANSWSATHGLRMPVIAAATGKRRVRASITLTPEKKAKELKMSPDEQNAMIRASVVRRKIQDLDAWYNQAIIVAGIVGSERGTAEDNAHEQINLDLLTNFAQTKVDDAALRAAKRLTGTQQYHALQTIRNKQEEQLIKHVRSFMKQNSCAWDLTRCNMNICVQICASEDTARTPGYPLKERHEGYFAGAICGYAPPEAVAFALAHDAWAKTTRVGSRKLGKGNKDMIKESTWITDVAFNIARDGSDQLRMLPETCLKNLILRKRHRIDWSSFLARGEPCPRRTNAAFQIEADPEAAQRDPLLLPIVIHGFEKGSQIYTLNEQQFAESRVGLPSYLECHELSPSEAVQSVKKSQLPDRAPFHGATITVSRPKHIGAALVIDRHVRIGEAISICMEMRKMNMKVKSFTDNIGHDGASNIITLGAVAEIGRKATDFYQRINGVNVDRLNTADEWRMLGDTLAGVPLIDAATNAPRALTDTIFDDFMTRYSTVHAPAQYMGVVTTADVIQAFIRSTIMDEDDPCNGTVHIYVVRSLRNPQHTCAVAWQFTAQHLTNIADSTHSVDIGGAEEEPDD